MKHVNFNAAALWCPSQPWGSYIPQGAVTPAQPTTTYGYNAWCMDPGYYGRKLPTSGKAMPRKQAQSIQSPGSLFILADSGVVVASFFTNSHMIEPPHTTYGPGSSTHFRHLGRTVALCADAHADAFDRDGGTTNATVQSLGTVGPDNTPHYDDRYP